MQVARIETGGLTIQEIMEQVQSRAEEMDTMQASGCLFVVPLLHLFGAARLAPARGRRV